MWNQGCAEHCQGFDLILLLCNSNLQGVGHYTSTIEWSGVLLSAGGWDDTDLNLGINGANSLIIIQLA